MTTDIEKAAEEWAEIEAIRREPPGVFTTWNVVPGLKAYQLGCKAGFLAGHAHAKAERTIPQILAGEMIRGMQESLSKQKLNETHANKWISVKERLPEVGVMVVGFRLIMGTFSIVFLASDGNFMFAYEAEHASDITHWMPLPPAPKGEE